MPQPPLRRQDRAISDRAAIDAILRAAPLLRLAMCQDGQPYVVPLNFGYDGARIYFHSAREGRKLAMLAANPRVCFEATSQFELKRHAEHCQWGARYQSVIGFGRAEVLSDPAEKERGLRLVMEHYAGPGSYAFPAAQLARVAVVAITIEALSGKQAPAPGKA